MGGLASSAQHHQGDGPTSSLKCVNMGTEQCAVVISLLKLKLWLRSIQSQAEKQCRGGSWPLRSTYEPRGQRDRWQINSQCHWLSVCARFGGDRGVLCIGREVCEVVTI